MGKSTNLDSRARIGLVLARDESERGALLILDISTGQMMKRTHFHLADGPSFLERVKEFLSSGKFRSMKVFDVALLEKFAASTEDLDITPEDYNSSVVLVNELDNSSDFDDNIAETDEVVPPKDSDNLPVVATSISSKISPVTKASDKKNSKRMPKQVFKLSNDHAFPLDTERDGSCLFHAVSWYFREYSGHSALELRDLVCNYILVNWGDPACEGGITIIDIIKSDMDEGESEIMSDEGIIEAYVKE